MRGWKTGMLAALGLAGVAGAQAPASGEPPGQAVYETVCAECHEAAADGGSPPSVADLRRMPAARIAAALSEGAMKAVGDSLTPDQRRDVAAYLGEGATAPSP